MLRVGQNLNALLLAPRLSGSATHDARAIVARDAGSVRGRTLHVAATAMLRVTGQIYARSVTVGVTLNARKPAFT